MKKSKKMTNSRAMFLELSGALPIVRKTLQTEAQGVRFDHLEPGDVIRLPKFKGKEFIIVNVSKFGGYIHYVPFKQLESAYKEDLKGATVSKHGAGSQVPIEV